MQRQLSRVEEENDVFLVYQRLTLLQPGHHSITVEGEDGRDTTWV